MITCFTNCLSNYMDTESIKLFIPSLPYILPSQWNGNNILSVMSPFCLTFIGEDLVIDGPLSCCNTEATIIVDVTECTVNSFATEISTTLGLTEKKDVVVTDGKVCGWSEECDTEVNCAFEVCFRCNCKVKGRAVSSDELYVSGNGDTNLSDGMYTIYIQKMPNMNSPKYSPIIQLMVRRQQQYRQGYTTSMTVNHGIESVQSARKLVDYDAQIEKSFNTMKRAKGVRVYRGTSKYCGCGKAKFSKWSY